RRPGGFEPSYLRRGLFPPLHPRRLCQQEDSRARAFAFMSFPRSQLDDRRRRVLTEEVIGPAQPADGAAGTASQSKPSDRRRSALRVRPYGDAALMDRQPRITDLVPQRYSMLALLF